MAQQPAVSQLQGVEGGTLPQQQVRRIKQPSPLIRRGNGHDPHAGGPGLTSQRHHGGIQQVQMQAAKAEAAAGDGLLHNLRAAVAAKAHLSHKTLRLAGRQDPGAGAVQSPVKMLGPVDAVDSQLIQPVQFQMLKAGAHHRQAVPHVHPRQKLAGDPIAMPGHGQSGQGLAQIDLGRSVGRRCFKVVDADGQGPGNHLLQLQGAGQGAHEPQGENTHFRPLTKGPPCHGRVNNSHRRRESTPGFG